MVRSLAGMVLLALCGLAPGPTKGETDVPVTLTLRGDEAPETIRKLVDSLSGGGRRVEIRLGGPEAAPTPSPSPSTAAPASAPVPAGAAASSTEAGVEAIWDHFVEGFDHGNAAIPYVVDLPGDWGRAWAANRNGATGPSARCGSSQPWRSRSSAC